MKELVVWIGLEHNQRGIKAGSWVHKVAFQKLFFVGIILFPLPPKSLRMLAFAVLLGQESGHIGLVNPQVSFCRTGRIIASKNIWKWMCIEIDYRLC
jgi:hypothetical protein